MRLYDQEGMHLDYVDVGWDRTGIFVGVGALVCWFVQLRSQHSAGGIGKWRGWDRRGRLLDLDGLCVGSERVVGWIVDMGFNHHKFMHFWITLCACRIEEGAEKCWSDL